jgi:hypothetical protein
MLDTTNWIEVKSENDGVGSKNCYAEINTNVKIIPAL